MADVKTGIITLKDIYHGTVEIPEGIIVERGKTSFFLYPNQDLIMQPDINAKVNAFLDQVDDEIPLSLYFMSDLMIGKYMFPKVFFSDNPLFSDLILRLISYNPLLETVTAVGVTRNHRLEGFRKSWNLENLLLGVESGFWRIVGEQEVCELSSASGIPLSGLYNVHLDYYLDTLH